MKKAKKVLALSLAIAIVLTPNALNMVNIAKLTFAKEESVRGTNVLKASFYLGENDTIPVKGVTILARVWDDKVWSKEASFPVDSTGVAKITNLYPNQTYYISVKEDEQTRFLCGETFKVSTDSKGNINKIDDEDLSQSEYREGLCFSSDDINDAKNTAKEIIKNLTNLTNEQKAKINKKIKDITTTEKLLEIVKTAKNTKKESDKDYSNAILKLYKKDKKPLRSSLDLDIFDMDNKKIGHLEALPVKKFKTATFRFENFIKQNKDKDIFNKNLKIKVNSYNFIYDSKTTDEMIIRLILENGKYLIKRVLENESLETIDSIYLDKVNKKKNDNFSYIPPTKLGEGSNIGRTFLNSKDIIVKSNDGSSVEGLKFLLFNSSRQTFEKELMVKDSKLSNVTLIDHERYFLQLLDKNYEMKNVYFYLTKNDFSPFNYKTENNLTELVVDRKEKPSDNIKKTITMELSVKYNGQSAEDGTGINFISEYGIIKTNVSNGKVSVDLYEDVSYVVQPEDKKYKMDVYPLIIKDKQEWGYENYKFLFDHSSCNHVEELVLRDFIQNNNGKIISVNENKSTNIVGMDFKDLLLYIDSIDVSNVEILKGKNIEGFDIILMNDYRSERTKIAFGNFLINKRITNKIISNVYYLDKDNNLEKLDFKQTKNNVSISNVKSLGIKKLIIEYSDDEYVITEEDKAKELNDSKKVYVKEIENLSLTKAEKESFKSKITSVAKIEELQIVYDEAKKKAKSRFIKGMNYFQRKKVERK